MPALKQVERPESAPAVRVGTERRIDLLLRQVVRHCQEELTQRGFRIDGRGQSGGSNWVRFRCRVKDAYGHHGRLVLLVAHDHGQRAVLVDAYFVDDALAIHTPRHKLLRRYDLETEPSRLSREVVDTVGSWAS